MRWKSQHFAASFDKAAKWSIFGRKEIKRNVSTFGSKQSFSHSNRLLRFARVVAARNESREKRRLLVLARILPALDWNNTVCFGGCVEERKWRELQHPAGNFGWFSSRANTLATCFGLSGVTHALLPPFTVKLSLQASREKESNERVVRFLRCSLKFKKSGQNSNGAHAELITVEWKCNEQRTRKWCGFVSLKPSLTTTSFKCPPLSILISIVVYYSQSA